MTKSDIIEALKAPDATALFKKADEIRTKYVGSSVHLRALVEFSNICKRHCKYCGLRCENTTLTRYRMSESGILACCDKAAFLGYRTIVMQSGEDDYFTAKKLCKIISAIKEKYSFAITLSIGERSKAEYRELKSAGADRFLLRIETTDRALYSAMHPLASFNERIRCLYNLKELGFEVGTGSLVGLKGQSIESLADDVLFFQKLDADMVGIGPFISHPATPLGKMPNGNIDTAMRVMALSRILLKDVNIPATTAMETLLNGGRELALKRGANVIMPNMSLMKNKKNYQIYPEKSGSVESAEEIDKKTRSLIKAIGRTIASDAGFRLKSTN